MKRRRLNLVYLLAAVILMAPWAAPAGQVKLSNDIAWVRTADAYKCCVQQAYANAGLRLRELARGKAPGTWCVVLDADETVISNQQFQAELQAAGQEYSQPAWTSWCQRGEAEALPGAKDFCSLVHELGGKVIIVTNRKGEVKDATIKNLDAVGIPYDAALVREGAYALDRSKERRRSDIERGMIKTLLPEKKLPPLKILMLVGDQTHDLYSDDLSFEKVKERFGKDLVIIPNPMYGDWARSGVLVEVAAGPAPVRETEPASGAITWQEALNRLGQDVVVEAKIVKTYDPERRGKKGPVKLNTDADYRKSLTIAFYKKDRNGNDLGFGDSERFYNKTVRVRGKVSEYQGSKQIMLKSPSDIEIIE